MSDDEQIRDDDHSRDHTDHHRMMIRDFRRRFYVSVVLSVPVLALSPLIQQFLGFSFGFSGDRFAVFGLATVIFVYGGWPFLTGLVDELRQRNPGMMMFPARESFRTLPRMIA